MSVLIAISAIAGPVWRVSIPTTIIGFFLDDLFLMRSAKFLDMIAIYTLAAFVILVDVPSKKLGLSSPFVVSNT